MNEPELVQRCREGDRQAQRELYAQNADRIYRLLRRMTGNADDAFELSQEAFLRAFTNIERFDGRASVHTWLYQIAVNEGRQFLRRQKRQKVKLTELEPPDRPGDAAATDSRLDIAAALAELPEEERTLLVLRYFEQLSYDQIAETIKKPPGTVASGLNRARQLLRNRLAPEIAPKT